MRIWREIIVFDRANDNYSRISGRTSRLGKCPMQETWARHVTTTGEPCPPSHALDTMSSLTIECHKSCKGRAVCSVRVFKSVTEIIIAHNVRYIFQVTLYSPYSFEMCFFNSFVGIHNKQWCFIYMVGCLCYILIASFKIYIYRKRAVHLKDVTLPHIKTSNNFKI